VGKGTQFIIRLPIAREKQPAPTRN